MIQIEKKIHHVWKQWEDAHGLHLRQYINPIIGKYQYIVSNEKGQKISLVELPNYFRDGKTLWEIYCLDGDLFKDVIRFDTFDDAMNEAKKYLKEGDKE